MWGWGWGLRKNDPFYLYKSTYTLACSSVARVGAESKKRFSLFFFFFFAVPIGFCIILYI